MYRRRKRSISKLILPIYYFCIIYFFLTLISYVSIYYHCTPNSLEALRYIIIILCARVRIGGGFIWRCKCSMLHHK